MSSGAEPRGDGPTGNGSPGVSLRAALLRFAVLVALVLAALAAYRWTPLAELLEEERLVELLGAARRTPWAPLLLFACWLLFSPLGVPVSPLVFAAGAVFGVWLGWLLSFLGALSGASLSFFLGRRLGHDLIQHLVGRVGLERAERAVADHGFWTVLRSRFLPLPFVLVNYAAALVGMRFPAFLLATAIGLAPSLLVYSYFSNALVQAAAGERAGLVRDLFVALFLFLLVTLLPKLVARLRRRR